MICSTCIHRVVCSHKKTIENFSLTNGLNDLLILGVQECVFHNSNEMIPLQVKEEPIEVVQYDKNEEIIKDFSKRSEMIKNSYRDAKGEEIICPSCKTKVTSLNKCIDCGKPVCPECGITVSIDAAKAGLMCQECWTDVMASDDEAQKNAVQLDVQDSSFLKNVVRLDIPRDK